MADVNVTIESMLMALIEGKKYRTLKDVLVTMNPADIALVLEEFDEESVTLIFRLLPKDQAAETFVEMESDMQEVLIKGFSDHELREVLEEIYVDDAVDLIEEMPANVVKRILAQADPQMRKEINEILRYPEDSAGSIMTTEYISLRPDMRDNLYLLCNRPQKTPRFHISKGPAPRFKRRYINRRNNGA